MSRLGGLRIAQGMSLARYAATPETGRGREFAEDRAGARGPRSEFQRDRDRIVHSIAFRRLRSKTQVFIAPDGDHYRTRLTHSIEVAQIGRVIARALGLDEDLTEALCLAHDIGHPPFGHAGEDALQAAMAERGGFDHNAHTLRTVMRLECPYCDHPGLNLSWDVLEGLAKHNGPVAAPNWALSEVDAAFSLDLGAWPSLEAQVAALADDIAYDNHDIDDGLRAGFLVLDDLMELPSLAERYREVERRYPRARLEQRLRELIRSQIGAMVNDVIETSGGNIADVPSVTAVRAHPGPLASFSPAMTAAERELKRFMYARLYLHPEQVAAANAAQDVVSRLFAAYDQDPAILPDAWRSNMPGDEPHRSRHLADYIAGMTDRYAIDQCTTIFGRAPAGLRNV